MIETPHAFHRRVLPRSVDLLDFAARVATEAHDGQFRKYTGEPYVVHPLRVGRIVAGVFPSADMVCAAYLHDTVEDTDLTVEDIATMGFGTYVAQLVNELTDVSRASDGNREQCKAIDREHSSNASLRGKLIKLADLLDNTCSIVTHDPSFARVYMMEKALLVQKLDFLPTRGLSPLEIGHRMLHDRALEVIRAYDEAHEDWELPV